MLYKEFYSEFGKLLYAVADIDKMITQQEKLTLQNIVKNELVPLDKHIDEFGTDAAFYSEIEFEYNDEQILDSESAFDSFIDFITEHHTAFDKKMKNVCIHIVEEIAASYRGKNKKEKGMIKRLKEKLKEIALRESNNHLDKASVDPLFSSEPNSDYSDSEVVETEAPYGDFDDIIEEHHHRFDKEVKKMSKGMTKNIIRSFTIFL